MWSAIFIFAKKELIIGSEDEIPPSPVFEPVGLFGEPAGEGDVGDWVDDFGFGVDVWLAGGCIVVRSVCVVIAGRITITIRVRVRVRVERVLSLMMWCGRGVVRLLSVGLVLCWQLAGWWIDWWIGRLIGWLTDGLIIDGWHLSGSSGHSGIVVLTCVCAVCVWLVHHRLLHLLLLHLLMHVHANTAIGLVDVWIVHHLWGHHHLRRILLLLMLLMLLILRRILLIGRQRGFLRRRWRWRIMRLFRRRLLHLDV